MLHNSGYTANDLDLPKWQSDLINQILHAVHDFYCLPEKFAANQSDLTNSLVMKCREYNQTLMADGLVSQPHTQDEYLALISKMNEALHAFDSHLELNYEPQLISKMVTAKKFEISGASAKFDFSEGPDQMTLAEYNEDGKKRSFGFIDYQGTEGVIPDNIGYVNISHLIDPQSGAKEVEDNYQYGPNAIKRLQSVMEQFKNKEGIVLDLSLTPFGGNPEMVQNIVSYFMPEHTPINKIQNRMTGEEKIYEAISTPFKMLDTPVVVLVGPDTFSGKEEIAYDLQQFNATLEKSRFTVMGQPTKGGAHPESAFPLVVDAQSGVLNDKLILCVPFARSINPYSGTNWEDQEKKGVQPDVLVKSEDVLKVAVRHLEEVMMPKLTSNATIAKALQVKRDLPAEIKKKDVISVTDEKELNITNPSVQKDNQSSSSEVDQSTDRKKISPFNNTFTRK